MMARSERRTIGYDWARDELFLKREILDSRHREAGLQQCGKMSICASVDKKHASCYRSSTIGVIKIAIRCLAVPNRSNGDSLAGKQKDER